MGCNLLPHCSLNITAFYYLPYRTGSSNVWTVLKTQNTITWTIGRPILPLHTHITWSRAVNSIGYRYSSSLRQGSQVLCKGVRLVGITRDSALSLLSADLTWRESGCNFLCCRADSTAWNVPHNHLTDYVITPKECEHQVVNNNHHEKYRTMQRGIQTTQK